MAGKGDRRRLEQVSREEMEDNWNLAFKRDKQNSGKSRHKRKQRDKIEPRYRK